MSWAPAGHIATHAHEYNTRTRTQKKLTNTTHAHEIQKNAHEIQKRLTNTAEAYDSEQKLLRVIRNIGTLKGI